MQSIAQLNAWQYRDQWKAGRVSALLLEPLEKLNFVSMEQNLENPILIVDDDQEDLDLIEDVVDHLQIKRPVRYFKSGEELEFFLRHEASAPFLIICDVNLPNHDGFTIKKRISEQHDLKYKSVPFIYWSTDASEKQIQYAYDLPAQGFFFKPSNFNDLCDTFRTILFYWQKSQHPKKVK